MPHINMDLSICLWHIPRTAGTFLRDELTRRGIRMDVWVFQHATVEDVGTRHPRFDHHAVIVRQRESWLKSVWEFLRKRPGTDVLARWFGDMTDNERADFDAFRVRYSNSYESVLEAYSPPGVTILRTEHVWNDAKAWLSTEIPVAKFLIPP